MTRAKFNELCRLTRQANGILMERLTLEYWTEDRIQCSVCQKRRKVWKFYYLREDTSIIRVDFACDGCTDMFFILLLLWDIEEAQFWPMRVS